jgi:uncharacterized damage-inducible protein DinB
MACSVPAMRRGWGFVCVRSNEEIIVDLLSHFRLLGEYNQWMNAKLYAMCSALPREELEADKKAFFGSILGTLNHIVVGDIIWLKRFAAHPSQHSALDPIRNMAHPKSLDQMLHSDFNRLKEEREKLDTVIIAWCDELHETDLHHHLGYHNMRGEPAIKAVDSLILHFFNHQTHHRGQTTTLLSQQGLDVGVTDLLALIPDESV